MFHASENNLKTECPKFRFYSSIAERYYFRKVDSSGRYLSNLFAKIRIISDTYWIFTKFLLT